MKNIYFIIIVLITSVFTSCNNESNILVPSDSDNDLQKQIVGTWKMQSGIRVLIYRSDFTFIDSSVSFVAQGIYAIKDSILFKSNITLKYIDPSHYPYDYNFTFPSKYLQFSNDKMTEIPVNVFEPTDGDNNELWGSWSRIEWGYFMRYNEPSYLGRIKIVENFNEVSKKAFWWSVYLDRENNNVSDTLWSNSVKYNPPILDMLGNGDYLVKVRFNNNKMYWWEPYAPIEYNCIK